MNRSDTIRHRIIPQALTVAAAGAAMLAGSTVGGAQQITDEELRSPGVFRTVIHRTEQVGWPHLATEGEQSAISTRILHVTTPTDVYATVNCRWPTGYVGRGNCSVRIYGGRNAGGVPVRSFTVRFRVFEDGSWKLFRVR